jgi:uncharacterized lipoprotein YajG
MISRPYRGRASLLLALLLALPACSSSTTTNPGDILRSVLVLTVTPNPAKTNLTSAPVLVVQYSLNVKETAGLGAEVQYVNGTLYNQVTGGTLAFNNYDSSDILVFVGSKRIEGGKSIDVTQQLQFVLPADSTNITSVLTVSVQVKDDRGNFVNQSILVPVE